MVFDVDAARARRRSSPVAVELVSMPWTSLNEPSLGLGILGAVLQEAGLASRIRHLNLSLLRYMRAQTYHGIAEAFALNDFLFTGVLDPALTTRQKGWLRTRASGLLTGGQLGRATGTGLTVDEVVDRLLDLRTRVIPSWLEEQADHLAGSAAPLIGFTCMFDQTIASIALAQLVKERAPDKLVALGGYAVREPTGTAVLEAFGWVDVICLGEGESSIVPLAEAAAGRQELGNVPGIVYRNSRLGPLRRTATPSPVDLATSPTPTFDDFFLDVADLSANDEVDVTVTRLPVENSRGCWWGEVRHCTFCGIHDDDLRYRTKPATVALGTMHELADRYGVSAFRFSDYILPRAYFTTLLPELERLGAPYALTAEMKANIDERQFQLLVAAGFVEVQPGIESFSGRALRSMDKGTSPTQNAHTLMWGRQYGAEVHWNLLYGFPDDDPDDYEMMLETLSRLTHLNPPATVLPVQVTRYAPLQADPERFGIREATYDPSYDLIFSRQYLESTGFDLSAYCYYFARPFSSSLRLTGIYRRIDALVDQWRAISTHLRPALTWRAENGVITITDSRAGLAVETVLGVHAGVVLRALRRSRTPNRLARDLHISAEHIEQALQELDRLRVVLRDEDRWVSLAVPAAIEPVSEQDAGSDVGVLVAEGLGLVRQGSLA